MIENKRGPIEINHAIKGYTTCPYSQVRIGRSYLRASNLLGEGGCGEGGMQARMTPQFKLVKTIG
jgi:hypothetical protein